MKLHDTLIEFLDGDDANPLIIKKTQEITPEFLSSLNDSRIDSMNRPMAEMERVASIPTIVVEKWMREGFNIYNESLPAIMAKLRQESLDYFITTEKRVA